MGNVQCLIKAGYYEVALDGEDQLLAPQFAGFNESALGKGRACEVSSTLGQGGLKRWYGKARAPTRGAGQRRLEEPSNGWSVGDLAA